MAKSHLKLVAPPTVNPTVTPRRLPNRRLRTREYLTEAEVEKLGHHLLTPQLGDFRAQCADTTWSGQITRKQQLNALGVSLLAM
jgi:hypothetical protein